ncbi:MAG: winged helix-turn-helix domain-containing protein [Candidatus Nanoarchaeia archaeon]|jgi:predicted transcriptional regulator|nr:winged helix-turn-helix domain-containing protein [Candidatus Nanoarchaeia archaeon]MDD3993577.1 winged helix-turn-helix domain-containing protein [Candidatus Nanoarchaeia archaeon]MDD4563789.1 winged helix-turn-helix domain-containing protein [Candidatus Nanoarchaeia archaeon]
MIKRGKLEIIKDILKIIQENHNLIKPTPLLRKSNMSSTRFKEYFNELKEKQLIIETKKEKSKQIALTEKGNRFLERYHTMINFIEEFEL